MNSGISTPIALLDDHESRDPWLLPTFPPGQETPAPESGETVLRVVYNAKATLELWRRDDDTWRDIWSAPKTATVTVTDRRVVVGCREYDRGSTYIGFGAGAVLALGATAISRARARASTRGSCLGLQLRHEWISHALHARTGPGWQTWLARCGGIPAQRVGVIGWDRGDRWRLLFGGLSGQPVDGWLASTLAQAIARTRMRHPELLDAEELAAVRPQAREVRLDATAGSTVAVRIAGTHTIGFQPAPAAEPPVGID
jgi:hypothetical protein